MFCQKYQRYLLLLLHLRLSVLSVVSVVSVVSAAAVSPELEDPQATVAIAMHAIIDIATNFFIICTLLFPGSAGPIT